MASRLKTQSPPIVSPTLAINQLSQKMMASGKAIFRFGFGQSPFPIPEHIVKTLQENAFQKDYLPTAGLLSLREQVAGHFTQLTSVKYTSENVMIGPGSKELLFLTQLANKCTLLLPSPSWVSYAPQARILEREVEYLPTKEQNDYCLDPELLAAYCQQNPLGQKLLILNAPNNPTGTMYPATTLRQLAEVCRKYQVIVISDEIYRKLYFEEVPESIATYYPEGTMITEGLSKWCGAGGWRLGVILIPDALNDWKNKMIGIASETFSCVSAPVQYAALAAYQDSEETTHYLKNCRAILKAVSTYVSHSLHQAKVSCPVGAGGFYLFPNFTNYVSPLQAQSILSSTQLCHRLLEESGVALLPGVAFGRPEEELTARLAFVDFDGAATLKWCNEKGRDQLNQQFMEECCPRIVEGTQKLISWLENL